MTNTTGFVIRDGLESDVTPCLALDAGYTTDHVWQMHIHTDGGERTINFKTERLPRLMDVQYPLSERRIRLATHPQQCFLVAVARDAPETLGFLVMRSDPSHQIAWIQDIVVSQPFRRHRIGSRLLRVARQWAVEHELERLLLETQTKNYPAILFCQKAGLSFCGFNDQYFGNQDIAVFFGQSLH